MTSKIRAVVLDWAGTVIDYGCFAPMEAFMNSFESAGVPIRVEEARAPMGLKKRDHIQAILSMERVKQAWIRQYGGEATLSDVERLYESFESLLMKSLENYTDPIPGVVETIARLRSSGIQIGSSTGYTKTMMQVVAPQAKSKGYEPDFRIASDEVKAARPYPYMIYRNMEELGVMSVRTVVKVGDTVTDVLEGKHAGVWTVAVVKGSSELGLTQEEVRTMEPSELAIRMEEVRGRFEQTGADAVIDSIAELPDIVEELNLRLKEEGLQA
ncbi:phosphonoacetaldehyde hydrolase [Paenibacillus sp. GYB004]|uniref:phosphonoacetaldehyde hydrolase n=1 Tax=Paenibacillus sp. GYB004 TaxID=2994393 RepID=UPI002F966743